MVADHATRSGQNRTSAGTPAAFDNHPGLARRTRNAEARRTAAGCGGLREPPEERHASAMRPDGNLRTGTTRPLQWPAESQRPARGFALQYLRAWRTSSGPDREPWR